MNFEVAHRFEGTTIDEVESLYLLDDVFNAETFARMGFDRTVIQKTVAAGRLVRALRVRSRSGIPAPFSALSPASSFHFDEEMTYDFAQHRGTWKTVPSVLAKQFHSSGTFAIGEEGGAVVFRLEGETRVSIPIVGGRAEKHAVATASRSHAAIADAIRAHLLANARRASASGGQSVGA